MSYGIYLYMQSIAGRGPGAALGVLAVIIVALGTYASHVIVERTSALTRSKRVADEELPPLANITPDQLTNTIRTHEVKATS
jgi:iron(III) transport system permease protein